MVVLRRTVNPPKWIVAKNKDDLLEACGSTYEDLKFPIIKEPNGLGQIGKPCDLTHRFTPKISIFCSHTYRPKHNPITKDYASKPKRKIKTLFENSIKCFFCRDHIGLEADVNVGDSQENPKVNILIVRSQLGERLLESAVKHRLLKLEEIKHVKIKRKQPYLWR